MVVIVRRIIYFFVIVVREEGGVPATMVTSSFTLGCETDYGIFLRQIRTKRICDLWQRTIHPNCFSWTSSLSFFKDSTCVWCEIESPPKWIQSKKLEDQHCDQQPWRIATSPLFVFQFSLWLPNLTRYLDFLCTELVKEVFPRERWAIIKLRTHTDQVAP